MHWALGLYRKAAEFYAREVDVLRVAGDQFAVVGPRYNIALLAGEMLESGQIELGEYLARVREVLDAALRVHHPAIEIRARLLLGEALEGAAAIDQATGALDRARRVGDRRSARAALHLLALRTGMSHPTGATRRCPSSIARLRTRARRERRRTWRAA